MIQARQINTIPSKEIEKIKTGIYGFDNLVGGGLVPGSTMLFAGEPGVGKSTLLLQLAAAFAKQDKVLYISGEESMSQIKLRADRLGAVNPQIYCSENIALEDILLLVENLNPKLMIIDSLQMVYSRASKVMPGSPSQMKKVLLKLISLAKEKDMVLITIGHSTKSGMIAGLLTLQHMVDATMFMSISEEDGIRLLEVKKNRFGAGQEIWEIEMAEHGFKDINEGVIIFENTDEIVNGIEKRVFRDEHTEMSQAIGQILEKAIYLIFFMFHFVKNITGINKLFSHKKHANNNKKSK